jgi:multidrug resistance efflux pump
VSNPDEAIRDCRATLPEEAEHPDTIALRECRAELATMQKRWLGASDIASQQRARAEQAESERDTAREYLRKYDEAVGDLDPPDVLVHWIADRDKLTALQAKVARAVALAEKWSTWLPAWAKDSLLEALR